MKIENDESIFSFLNPLGNDKISDLKGIDLQELINLLDKYYLTLRTKLGLLNNTTFGLELEFEYALKERLKKEIHNKFEIKGWRVKEDSTLRLGLEINSPVLDDNEKTWDELSDVCNILRKYANIGNSSGGHIHVGSQILGENREYWLNFIKLWSVYENIIFRFLYGEYLNNRPNISFYASEISNNLWNHYQNFRDYDDELEYIISILSISRYYSVNFSHVNIENCNEYHFDNTIEYRNPNGSLNPVIWQNNVNFLVKLLYYTTQKNYDNDLIEKRHEITTPYYFLKYYNEIFLEQALELCDMIFTNNLDKIYFLKQYLKSFQTIKNPNTYVKSREITKLYK